MTPHELSRKLESIYEENLQSVILYGSAVGSDFSKKFSDYNIIVVLNNCSPGEVARAGAVVRRWTRKGNPPPLFFDPRHVETSRDVFPLEFMDIRDRHQLLHGSDPFANIVVERKNLRHQCESELKGKLLHLRSAYAANAHRPRRLARLMVATFPTFNALLRGILVLMDAPAPRERAHVIEELSRRIDFNPTVFMDIIAVREGDRAMPRRAAALEAFEEYLTALETITSFVDQFDDNA